MKIEIKDKFLGTHYWTGCPYKEVAFLKNEHHHDFYINICCEVKHNDRDIEFIMLRIWLIKFMNKFYLKENEIFRFSGRSCEMISEDIKKNLIKDFGDKNWKVSVSEDNNYKGGDW